MVLDRLSLCLCVCVCAHVRRVKWCTDVGLKMVLISYCSSEGYETLWNLEQYLWNLADWYLNNLKSEFLLQYFICSPQTFRYSYKHRFNFLWLLVANSAQWIFVHLMILKVTWSELNLQFCWAVKSEILPKKLFFELRIPRGFIRLAIIIT